MRIARNLRVQLEQRLELANAEVSLNVNRLVDDARRERLLVRLTLEYFLFDRARLKEC